MDQTTQPQLPTPWPFDFENADIILRATISSDIADAKPVDLDFKIHRSILCIHSKFFASMFSLPQPTTSEDQAEPAADAQNPIKTESLPDHWASFYRVLIRAYALEETHPLPETQIGDIRDALLVAQKYDFDHVIPKLKNSLLSAWLSSKPLEVYLICCRFGFEKEAREAARRAILLPELLTGAEIIPSKDFRAEDSGMWLWNLLSFRTRCIKAIDSLKTLSTDVWLNEHSACMSLVGTGVCSQHRAQTTSNRVVVSWLRPMISEIILNTALCLLPRLERSLPFMSSFIIRSVPATCQTCKAHLAELDKFFELCIAPKIEQAIEQVSSTIGLIQ
jgi:hypothetical protein